MTHWLIAAIAMLLLSVALVVGFTGCAAVPAQCSQLRMTADERDQGFDPCTPGGDIALGLYRAGKILQAPAQASGPEFTCRPQGFGWTCRQR